MTKFRYTERVGDLSCIHSEKLGEFLASLVHDGIVMYEREELGASIALALGSALAVYHCMAIGKLQEASERREVIEDMVMDLQTYMLLSVQREFGEAYDG